MFLAHARQFANFSCARELLDAIHVGDFVGAPDQRDRLGPETLDLQQLQHRRVILLQQLGLNGELAGIEQFLQVGEHSLADAGNGEHLLGIADDFFDLVRMIFDGLRGIAVGADAEGILAVDLQQVGSFVEDVGNGLVIHVLKINKIRKQS